MFYIHSVSGDHDSRYYTKNEISSLLENFTVPFDPQDTPLLIDNAYGWRDLTSAITVRGNGSANPSWSTFRNGISAYEFQTGRREEFWLTFHIDHDYAMGTKVFPHVHWSTNSTATGTVRWGIEYTVAKGHAQSSGSIFGPTSIIYADTVVSSGDQYKHFVTEISEANAIPATLLEPDSLILVRFFRDGVGDSFPGSIHGFTADVHYQVARIATKNKSPNFFGV